VISRGLQSLEGIIISTRFDLFLQKGNVVNRAFVVFFDRGSMFKQPLVEFHVVMLCLHVYQKDMRISWNTVSVVDPLFTLPILLLVIVGAKRHRPVFARVALAWAVAYPTIGLLQRDRAVAAGWELVSARGHEPMRLEAKPSFGNILVWKTVYETNDRFYVDALRATFSPVVFPGDSVAKLDLARDLPWLDQNSQQATDIERFRWFSNGYIALDPDNKYKIIDIRYSMVPNQLAALWSIELAPQASATDHVIYRTHRDTEGNEGRVILDMLVGGG
jgi:inner membrane protein